MKKTLLFLPIALLFLTVNAIAQNVPTTFWSAVATTEWYNETDEVFTLTTAEEFAGLSVLVAGGNNFSGKTAIIANDLDLGAHLWTAIGPNNDFHFSGSVDGGGHTISNLFINEVGGSFIGLFGQCTNVTLSNITVSNVYIRAGDTIGSLAGNLSTNSNMDNCHANNVDIEASGYNVGGLVGGLLTNSNVTNCSSQGTVVGESQIGGLVGSPWDKTNISQSYSTGTVTASHLAGGLIGYSTFAFIPNRDNIINNCYSRCDVSVVNGRAGGLVGGTDANLFVYNSYSTGTATGPEYAGGLIGHVGSVTTTNNYWDTETSEHEDAIGGWGFGEPEEFDITGMTTASMKIMAMVTSLNQNQDIEPWTIDPAINDGYPILSENFTVSTRNIELSNVELTVYPTLVNSHITIETEAQLSSYTLFSVTGQAIQQGSLMGNSVKLDLQNVVTGAYILLVNTDQGSATQKLMKQ